ncbi:MAG TPA: hypothetical protein VFD93_00660 [Candidatus Acidoferrales bacterium]|nr:hypothetical protein [Candidatus Acidoferrales bacterium]
MLIGSAKSKADPLLAAGRLAAVAGGKSLTSDSASSALAGPFEAQAGVSYKG